MDSIINYMKEWFLPKKEYFNVFIRNDTRVEAWFKGELLVLFSRLIKENVIDTFEREQLLYNKKGKRNQIDFSVIIKGVKHYLEIKAFCISQSKGTPRNISFYWGEDNVGIIKDFKKLNELNIENKWVCAFIYPKPTKERWNKVNSKLFNWKCLTKLEDYPSHLFIALFH